MYNAHPYFSLKILGRRYMLYIVKNGKFLPVSHITHLSPSESFPTPRYDSLSSHLFLDIVLGIPVIFLYTQAEETEGKHVPWFFPYCSNWESLLTDMGVKKNFLWCWYMENMIFLFFKFSNGFFMWANWIMEDSYKETYICWLLAMYWELF